MGDVLVELVGLLFSEVFLGLIKNAYRYLIAPPLRFIGALLSWPWRKNKSDDDFRQHYREGDHVWIGLLFLMMALIMYFVVAAV